MSPLNQFAMLDDEFECLGKDGKREVKETPSSQEVVKPTPSPGKPTMAPSNAEDAKPVEEAIKHPSLAAGSVFHIGHSGGITQGIATSPISKPLFPKNGAVLQAPNRFRQRDNFKDKEVRVQANPAPSKTRQPTKSTVLAIVLTQIVLIMSVFLFRWQHQRILKIDRDDFVLFHAGLEGENDVALFFNGTTKGSSLLPDVEIRHFGDKSGMRITSDILQLPLDKAENLQDCSPSGLIFSVKYKDKRFGCSCIFDGYEEVEKNSDASKEDDKRMVKVLRRCACSERDLEVKYRRDFSMKQCIVGPFNTNKKGKSQMAGFLEKFDPVMTIGAKAIWACVETGKMISEGIFSAGGYVVRSTVATAGQMKVVLTEFLKQDESKGKPESQKESNSKPKKLVKSTPKKMKEGQQCKSQ